MIKATIAALGLAPLVYAQVQHYEIRPSDSNKLELRVAKTGLYRGKVHVFVFPQYSGTLGYDPQKPENSRVSLTISASDIKLTDTWLSEKDFKSVQEYALQDMLAANKYPEIQYQSADVRGIDASHFEVRGTLTIRGIAKPTILHVMLDSGPRFAGEAVIRLTDYGLKPPKAALGLVGTENEMKFSFLISPTTPSE
jgi:polyisoprenoid-binding protein YceI